MKRLGLATAVGRVGGLRPGAPRVDEDPVLGLELPQAAGRALQGARLLEEPRPPSLEASIWGELGDHLSEGMDMGFLHTSTPVFHSRSPEERSEQSQWGFWLLWGWEETMQAPVPGKRDLVPLLGQGLCALMVQPEPRNSRRAEGHQRDQCARCGACSYGYQQPGRSLWETSSEPDTEG